MRTEPIVSAVRREIRKLFPDVKVGNDNLMELIESEVIKRDTIEGDKAKEAHARMRKAANRLEKARSKALKVNVSEASL